MQDNDMYIKNTRCWIERVVIEYNLCPFARTPYDKQQIRYVVSEATKAKALLNEVEQELHLLQQTPIEELETTVLIHPFVLQDFFEYNDFLEDVDDLLEALELAGEFQVASLHPQYQFADTDFDDAENYTNRSPYPILHLLREESIDRALETYSRPERIPDRNIRIMEKHGADFMKRLLQECMKEE
jgi:hypothetical protein